MRKRKIEIGDVVALTEDALLQFPRLQAQQQGVITNVWARHNTHRQLGRPLKHNTVSVKWENKGSVETWHVDYLYIIRRKDEADSR